MGGGGSNDVKETEAEKAAADVAMQQWKLYQDELKDFEQTFIQRIDNLNSESSMREVGEQVDLSYAKSYSDARDATADQMAASGIDPSSQKFQATMNDITTEQGILQGDAVNRSQVGLQDRHITGLQDIAAIGQGQSAEALASMGDMASLSSQKANQDAINSINTRSAMLQTAGSVAGAGAAYGLRSTQTPSTYQKMQAGSQNGFSPMGGASSYGVN